MHRRDFGLSCQLSSIHRLNSLCLGGGAEAYSVRNPTSDSDLASCGVAVLSLALFHVCVNNLVVLLLRMKVGPTT